MVHFHSQTGILLLHIQNKILNFHDNHVMGSKFLNYLEYKRPDITD